MIYIRRNRWEMGREFYLENLKIINHTGYLDVRMVL